MAGYHSGVGLTSWRSGTLPFYSVGTEKICQAKPTTEKMLNNMFLSYGLKSGDFNFQ